MVRHQAPVKSLLTCRECKLELRLFGIETETPSASSTPLSALMRPPRSQRRQGQVGRLKNPFGNACTHLAAHAIIERLAGAGDDRKRLLPIERVLARTALATRSPGLEVDGRLFPPVALDLVLDGLSLVERVEARPLNGRDVNKHVPAAARRLNEPISFCRVEPLHGTSSHFRLQC